MRIPKTLYLLFAAALVMGLLPLTVAARPAAQAAMEPELLTQLNTEGQANFFVKMAVDADLSAAYAMNWQDRGEYVWNALNEVAAKSQAPVIEYAKQHGLNYTSMLTTNSVLIRGGSPAAANDLAGLPGVAYLRLERILELEPIVTDGQPAPEYTKDWGLIDTNADDVWALGYQGAGMKVANIDTGVQYNHPALDQAFACPGQPGNAACWKDPANICGGSACDNVGHGTHTMGTMVGDNDPSLTYWVGMAPDATWIACKGCESNSCSEGSLNTCADWIVAPNGNPANRPNVVNNSWGGGGGDNWYLAKVNAWRAAGIFPAFSAGNSGSSCSTLGSPGDYQESFGSAAHSSSRTIASFSSRGPSAYGHAPYTKPNLSAPGVSICSSVPTNGWNCTYSGTSMASPHTAGAVALIWSACPSYVGQIDSTFQLLQNNTDAPPAGNCGNPGDGGNYTYGYGYLNALKAVQACATACDPVTNAAFTWTPTSPFAGQQVTFNGTADGTAPISYGWTFGDGGNGSGATVTHTYASAGNYTVTMTATNACGSQSVQHTVTVQPVGGNTLHLNIMKLNKSNPQPGLYKIIAQVRVHDQNHAVASGVTVTGRWTKPDGSTLNQQAVTNAQGQAKFPQKFYVAGTYQFCVTDMTKAGYTYNPAANEQPACLSVVVP